MLNTRLIFHPENPQQEVQPKKIIEALTETQFVQNREFQHNHYLPGENFLSLITFLGCSPNINLSPDDGDQHCYIALLETFPEEKCLGYTHTANPKCPACTKRINNWQQGNWLQSGAICICDKCQSQTTYANLNWKQECGFARGGFFIQHIYPHEAVPGEKILNALKNKTGFNWTYCYANNSDS